LAFLFPRINDDAWPNSHQVYTLKLSSGSPLDKGATGETNDAIPEN